MAILTAKTELNKALELALEVGCDQEQMRRFLLASYVPQPKQMRFHAAARECDEPGGPTRVGYGGTRGQAKSHAALAQFIIDDGQRYPGLKGLYLRKIGRAALESFEDLLYKVLMAVPCDFKPGRGLLTLPNGSRVVLGGYRSESDIDKYLGIEYDVIVLEDATELTENKYKAILGSLRTSKAGWRPRLYATANPGGSGHGWFKKEFYTPWAAKMETETKFIHATLGDNVFINPEYRSYLDSLTGFLRRAWRDGDFEISAGQFFNTFRVETHVVDPIAISPTWRVWLAMDYGFGLTHWNVIYLLVETHNNVVYVVEELAHRKTLVPTIAADLRAALSRWRIPEERLWRFVAGGDVTIKQGTSGTSILDQWREEGFRLEPANMDRVNGAAEVLKRLGNPESGIEPTLYIFRNCTRLIDCLPMMEHDPHRPSDVRKVIASEEGVGGDDPYDALRYGLMAVTHDRRARVH